LRRQAHRFPHRSFFRYDRVSIRHAAITPVTAAMSRLMQQHKRN
jgi:hypothetical protein